MPVRERQEVQAMLPKKLEDLARSELALTSTSPAGSVFLFRKFAVRRHEAMARPNRKSRKRPRPMSSQSASTGEFPGTRFLTYPSVLSKNLAVPSTSRVGRVRCARLMCEL